VTLRSMCFGKVNSSSDVGQVGEVVGKVVLEGDGAIGVERIAGRGRRGSDRELRYD
jgi:hypothetical protein